mmetsp:Transcript_9215/g.16201  ORF Transcript_9215/g.16201 Transcript_9215/m.16201 type:complete len:312 (+) Transcript_9215:112-1047(+)|eukprot:CAMPEP_0119103184 /NCGR_PEP_ID=MMETSP1180-20130426/1693_1 /TAXON_ID=3052 ORGANISM="Chlamydomonas cf sp, Strain CCMP681" /NCGR_SAMPLE_ID=MMETSP1180 /ASSEMBLY_ACC=CAM_ASM_000741 /LENGTH=311 /DNA_ID=CAMNT_0007087629 /DNA_START=112 /DNA_END=1047 /DNA_ORIENTATION=+
MFTQQPVTRQTLAELKSLYDLRQRNAEFARSLEEFYISKDQGNGSVRQEDFKAGWTLGGVQMGPFQLATLKGAFGNADGSIRYNEALDALDNLDHEQGLSIVMTERMGPITARHMGYKQGNPVMPGYLDHASAVPSRKTTVVNGSLDDSATVAPGSPNHQANFRTGTAFNTTTGLSTTKILAGSLLRSSNITPVMSPPTSSATGTFNCTTVCTAQVTQRCKSMVPVSVTDTLEKLQKASAHSPLLAETLATLDQAGTGCVTLDSFLTACARAGLTLKPEELEALRASGKLRRPYDAAPELIQYDFLPLTMA